MRGDRGAVAFKAEYTAISRAESRPEGRLFSNPIKTAVPVRVSLN